jgi:hypothetical protein
MKRFKWNLGVLRYYPIDKDDATYDDIKQEIARRQSAGAKHTHEVRRKNTEERIRLACEELKAQHLKVTRKSISQITGIGVSSMSNHKNLIKSINNQDNY